MPDSALTFANIRVFEALARHESFSRAAEELHVSQPYVSAQISSLEARLGVQLFRRTGRRAYLSEPGRLLQKHAVAIIHEFAEAERAMSEVRGAIGGTLSISATATPAAFLLPDCLERFLASYPDVSINLKVFGSPEVERSVREGRADLGVLVSLPSSSGFVVDEVGQDELVVVLNPAHPLAGHSEILPEQLANERFIVREPSSGTRRFLEARLRTMDVELNYGPELNSNEAIKAMVASNLGISILSLHAVRLELLAKNLTAVRVKGLPLVRTLNLISCEGAKPTPGACALRAVMLANYRAEGLSNGSST